MAKPHLDTDISYRAVLPEPVYLFGVKGGTCAPDLAAPDLAAEAATTFVLYVGSGYEPLLQNDVRVVIN